MRAGELSRRRPARDIKGCCAAAPTGRDERETRRERERERERRGGRGRRGIPWCGGSQGTKGSGPTGAAGPGRGKARRGEARRAFETRVPLAPELSGSVRAHGKPFEKRDSPRPTAPWRASSLTFISVNLFVGGAAPALHPWPGNRPVLTRHRDNIAPRCG